MQRNPASFRQHHMGPFQREGHEAETPFTLISRFRCVALLGQPGWWQEQVLSSGDGQQAQHQHTFDCFQVTMLVLCSDTEYVT